MIPLDEELRRLAAAAGVAAPTLEVREGIQRLAAVRHGRAGVRVLVRPEALTLPRPILRGILAHEVAHVALRHPATRRRLRVALVVAVNAIMISAAAATGVLSTQTSWLWPAPAAVVVLALPVGRAVLLAVLRHQEFEADRVAATLLGIHDPVVAFLDWVSSHGGDKASGLWNATHPSNAARRKALLGTRSSRL